MLTMLTARVNRTVFGGVHCDGAISCPLRRLLRGAAGMGAGHDFCVQPAQCGPAQCKPGSESASRVGNRLCTDT
jgi:hypothetical protein